MQLKRHVNKLFKYSIFISENMRLTGEKYDKGSDTKR